MKNKILNLILKGDSLSLSVIYTIGQRFVYLLRKDNKRLSKSVKQLVISIKRTKHQWCLVLYLILKKYLENMMAIYKLIDKVGI